MWSVDTNEIPIKRYTTKKIGGMKGLREYKGPQGCLAFAVQVGFSEGSRIDDRES